MTPIGRPSSPWLSGNEIAGGPGEVGHGVKGIGEDSSIRAAAVSNRGSSCVENIRADAARSTDQMTSQARRSPSKSRPEIGLTQAAARAGQSLRRPILPMSGRTLCDTAYSDEGHAQSYFSRSWPRCH